MDPARLGRALGLGTRGLAKTLVRVADATTAPNPNPPVASSPGRPATPASAASVAETIQTVRRAHATGSGTLTRMTAAGRQAGKTALAPVTRAAGVMWFEITGVFFGIFAAGLGIEAWKQRANLFLPGDMRLRAWGTLIIAVFFAWFTVSSFLSARRRQRR